MEAIGPPFYKSYFGWGKQEIGLLFMCVAVTAIIGYSSMKYLAAEVENKGIAYILYVQYILQLQ